MDQLRLRGCRAHYGALIAAFVMMLAPAHVHAAGWTLIGWNNLGMHCMDDDFSVFSLLPPYNTIHAQLVDPQGQFVSDPAALGIAVFRSGRVDRERSEMGRYGNSGRIQVWEG